MRGCDVFGTVAKSSWYDWLLFVATVILDDVKMVDDNACDDDDATGGIVDTERENFYFSKIACFTILAKPFSWNVYYSKQTFHSFDQAN